MTKIKTPEEILEKVTGTDNHKNREALIHIDFVFKAMENYAALQVEEAVKKKDERIKELEKRLWDRSQNTDSDYDQ